RPCRRGRGASAVPDERERLRDPLHAAALHVDRTRPVLESHLGLTGYVSFGHVAFFGMGAYTAAILIAKLGWPWVGASLAGGAMAMLLAFAIGWPCLRLKGPYFAIAMLGLNEVLRVAVSYYEGLTGGGNGLSLPTLHASVPIYYAMALVAAGVTAL